MLSPNGIQAVLFDLDGTLRHDHPNSFTSFCEFVSECGCDLTPEQQLAGYRWVLYYWSVSPDLQADLEALGAGTAAFWRRHTERQLEAMGVTGDLAAMADRIQQCFQERYQPDNHVPEDVIPTLQRLKALGFTVGLVSNRTEPLDNVVLKCGLADFFVFTLSAGQAGCWKPAPDIFRQALALAGCPPEAAVYVGDNYYADVEGARAVGLHPVLIDPLGAFAEPGCPVIHSLGELEGVLQALGGHPGTNSGAEASLSLETKESDKEKTQ